MDTTTSNDSNSAGGRESKRQQFTNKQRMDMYAFCVLELEMHSHKVSIKKKTQALQRVLDEQRGETHDLTGHNNRQNNSNNNNNVHDQQQEQVPELQLHIQLQSHELREPNPIPDTPAAIVEQHNLQQQHSGQQAALEASAMDSVEHEANMLGLTATLTALPDSNVNIITESDGVLPMTDGPQTINIATQTIATTENADLGPSSNCNNGLSAAAAMRKTLLELQQEVDAVKFSTYSDFQKTQVLTSSMLREVQRRFAKYYPDSAIPSRTTIKHVFQKCVSHGTVENIKTPRKAVKIPRGDEIEHLLIHEPQLSLRQMARKLNVSTGTVSRRCRALGLVPESVTIKHQQMATARRQKQMKQNRSPIK